MSEPRALDTSVAVPLAVETHPDHAGTAAWRGTRACSLAGHASAETYSVLTRLPSSLRVSATDVVRALASLFDPPLVLPGGVSRGLPAILADAGVVGGAVYDALVGLAARENGFTLATRDARAKRTYEALGVEVELVG